ncbi:nucleotidyl transferase AbiEii/AbiGii toxin family protein [Candidatus Peregrinibacteria bacterium]|nr:nucleotidyl transferase AbiEii/AbiGii toxin family protein [Candidatus Peregrinibacteria bacterium]
MSIFENIFSALNKAKIAYLVVGGVAVNLHGYTRFTGDLDLLVLLKEKNLEKLDRVMKKMHYSERIPVSILELHDNEKVRKWLKTKNLKAYSFLPPAQTLLQIDIIIEESLKFDHFYQKKITKRINGVSIPIACIDDLILMKRHANRMQDVNDIQALIDLKRL